LPRPRTSIEHNSAAKTAVTILLMNPEDFIEQLFAHGGRMVPLLHRVAGITWRVVEVKMSIRKTAVIRAATFFLSAPAFAQNYSVSDQYGQASQAGVEASSQRADSANASGMIKVTGCLVKEGDYRKAHHLGSGALGGVGLGDEFVVVNATIEPASAMP